MQDTFRQGQTATWEGPLPGGHLVEHGACRPNVGASVQLFVQQPLQRHIRQSANRASGHQALGLRGGAGLTDNLGQVKIDFSRPGKPTDNAYVESFNGTLRAECLDAHWFTDLGRADAERIYQRDRG